MLPSIFISHGSPALAIMDNDLSDFFKNLPKKFEKPKYILVISAHWNTNELRILKNEKPSIIYDFYGFPKELYEKKYSAQNDIIKVNEIVELLKNNNITILEDNDKEGYDHGVWAPLSLMYEKADIPIIQVSLPIHYSSKDLYKLGKALIELKKDTLIIASGTMTHNLRDSDSHINADVKEYARNFRDYIIKNVKNKNIINLINYETKAPNVEDNHPSLEHFSPFFVALGASENMETEILNSIYMYGNQAMDSILFKD